MYKHIFNLCDFIFIHLFWISYLHSVFILFYGVFSVKSHKSYAILGFHAIRDDRDARSGSHWRRAVHCKNLLCILKSVLNIWSCKNRSEKDRVTSDHCCIFRRVSDSDSGKLFWGSILSSRSHLETVLVF